PPTATTFSYAGLDAQAVAVAVPMRTLLEARGESLHVTLVIVGSALARDPTAWGAEVTRAVQHLDTSFGLVPDLVEINEPNTFGWADGSQVGNAMAEAGRQLRAAGYAQARMMGPTVSKLSVTPAWFDRMIAVPDLPSYLALLSYHRYGWPPATTEQMDAVQS